MKKIGYLFVFVAFGLLNGCSETEPTRPNILFIMSDDHTSQAWGVYGGILQDHVQNLNISRLADEGMVLNNVFCTNSICVPSRASIQSGQYSHRNGVRTLSDAFDPAQPNIAKVLQGGGYQTALIGKWHLKKQPSGFDHFMVLPGQGRYHDPKLKTRENWQDGNKGGKSYPGFSSDVITDFSLEWLKTTDKTRPFFLMTHFKATHGPWGYPKRLADLYKGEEIPEPASLFDFGPETTGRTFPGQNMEELARRFSTRMKKIDEQGLPFSTEGLDSIQARKKTYQQFIKDYLRGGAAIDENIGRLLDYLEENGLAENTVVIYTADQGFFLGEHGFFDKRLIYEESLRMPFVIRYPKELAAGTRIDDIILNIDFPSLFADYAGLENPDFVQGKSFRQNLKGNTPADWRKSMYYRYFAHAPIRPGHFGIRNKRYKLAFFYGQSLDLPGTEAENSAPAWEFYDLETDPTEIRNAYQDPQYTTVITEMKKELVQLRAEVGDTDEEYPIMDDIIQTYWNP